MTSPVPERLRPRDDAEVVLVYDIDAPRDATYNRLQFVCLWLTRQQWVPDGVRGQVFHADPDQHALDWIERGYSIRWEPPA